MVASTDHIYSRGAGWIARHIRVGSDGLLGRCVGRRVRVDHCSRSNDHNELVANGIRRPATASFPRRNERRRRPSRVESLCIRHQRPGRLCGPLSRRDSGTSSGHKRSPKSRGKNLGESRLVGQYVHLHGSYDRGYFVEHIVHLLLRMMIEFSYLYLLCSSR